MSNYKKWDYSTPQNKHDEFLEQQFPNVPLSLMRDIYEIHKTFDDEQQEDFNNAIITSNWGFYDEKYNLGKTDLKYDTYEDIYENMEKKQEKIDLELKKQEEEKKDEIEQIE